MGFTGLPRALAEWIDILGLPPVILIAALMVFYIVIGMLLDVISAVVVTMVRTAAFADLGIDIMIWFGIFVVVVVEMGHISRTAMPMFLVKVLMVGVLVLYPEPATWFPETLRARS